MRLVLLLALLARLPLVWSNVSVNLKSKVLTDILKSDNNNNNNKDPRPGAPGGVGSAQPSPTVKGQTSASSPSPHTGRDASDLLRLDLSGRLNLHLWGMMPPTQGASERSIRPLLPLGSAATSSRRPPPHPPVSIKIGLDYDLADRQQQRRGWYGVQRVFTSLGWTRSRRLRGAATKITSSKLQPRRVEFTVERGLNAAVDTDSAYAGHVKVGWDDPFIHDTKSSGRLPFVKMGVDCIQTKKDNLAIVGALMISIPLHRRLLWHGKISRPLCTLPQNQHAVDGFSSGGGGVDDDADAENFVDSSRRIPLPPVSDLTDMSSWLIPEVTVNAIGQMESNTQAWFRMPMLKQRHERHDDDNGRLGIRLTIRRQFDWDYPMLLSGLLGTGSSSSSNSNSDMHDASTAICLEIKGMTPRTITTARFETSLQEPLDAAHLSILQYLACE
jgi:hypothetical protein